MYDMLEREPLEEQQYMDEKAKQGSMKEILTQPAPEHNPYTEEMIKEKLGAEAGKVLDWIKTLPPELQEQAYYWAITYLDQTRISYQEIKKMLEQGIYLTYVEEVDQTSNTAIGQVDVVLSPGGEKRFLYKGKEIEDVVIARYEDTYVILPNENLPKQYEELKEDGYEEIFYVHKDGDKLVIERVDQEGERPFDGIRSYMLAVDGEGEHVIEFKYVNEGNPITYWRVDGGEWKKLESKRDLIGYLDEAGRPLSELLVEEDGFFYPLHAFKATYVGDKIIEGAYVENPTEFLEQRIEEVPDSRFYALFREVYQRAFDTTSEGPKLTEEQATQVLKSYGYTEDQIDVVLSTTYGDSALLGRVVSYLTSATPKEEFLPIVRGKDLIQAYIDFLEGKEVAANLDQLTDDQKKKLNEMVEAIKAMDWHVDEEKLKPYLAQMLLNKKQS